MMSIEEKLKYLLKEAKLQGFVGIAQIKEIAENSEEESFLSQKLQDEGFEINYFLQSSPKNYKTVLYSNKKESKFSLTTRVGENGEMFLLAREDEKDLFEKLTNARNKMLKSAFANIKIQDFIKKLANKVETGTVKISSVIKCEKDEEETEKNKFEEAIKNLENYNEEQIIDLLFSLNFKEKTKGIIYNKFAKMPDYINEIKNELYEAEQTYSTVKREIIEANIGLVFCIAKDYSIVHKGILDISDIIQEGNMGLIDAVESFDYTKGVKFSSWAVWYIRRQIWTAINSFKKFVYVPPKASVDLHKILVFEEKYRTQHGKNASIQEIASEFNLKEKQVLSLLTSDFSDVNPNYEYAVSSDNTDEFNDESDNPFNAMAISGLKKEITDLLQKLGERERKIIKLHFGLEENSERLNLAQIGAIYGISRERVRQIIEKTIENIKELSADIIKEWK